MSRLSEKNFSFEQFYIRYQAMSVNFQLFPFSKHENKHFSNHISKSAESIFNFCSNTLRISYGIVGE